MGVSALDKLLRAFKSVFEGKPYIHRRSNIGNGVASYLYEDLASIGRSAKLVARTQSAALVVNTFNHVKGRAGRRGDGTLGSLAPTAVPISEEGYSVRRGHIATVEIGAEVKIMATKLTAQVDRVMTDLRNQANIFREQTSDAITVGIVGVNFADEYTGHEGERRHIATSPPSRQAPDIVRRLDQSVRGDFDELLVLRFKATNRPPYLFEWVNERETRLEYGSALIRISDWYERRF